MLAFIIPVKHPARSRSYRVLTDLLRRTLRSVCAQTHPAFGVIVVCNQKPDWAGEMEKVQFVEVDFPPAAPPSRREDWVEWIYEDRGSKVAVGLRHAQRLNPTHVMFVDADDFVSRRLAGFVREHPTVPGWYMPDGLLYSERFKIATPRDLFWSYCGTTHILRADLVPVPETMELRPTKDAVVGMLHRYYLMRILGCHVDFIKYFNKMGKPLEPLPFVGAVWHADHGENSSRAWWGGSRFGPIWGVPLTPEQSEEFSIAPEERSLPQSVLLYGWRARSVVARSVKRLVGIGPKQRQGAPLT